MTTVRISYMLTGLTRVMMQLGIWYTILPVKIERYVLPGTGEGHEAFQRRRRPEENG